MKFINCIAGVIMTRTAIVFSKDENLDFWGEHVELEKFCSGIMLEDYRECMEQENAKRYKYIVHNILGDNLLAQNVLDMSIAQMLFPAFGALLRRKTGYATNIANAARLQGYDGSFEHSPLIGEMYEAYKLLSVLYNTDDSASFFQTEHFCDNRILAFINGQDDCFLTKGAVICFAIGNRDEKDKLPFTISKFPFGIVARDDETCLNLATNFANMIDRNLVCYNAGFAAKNTIDKIVRRLIREAKFYNAIIFVSGFDEKMCKTIIDALCYNTKSNDIKWGIGISKKHLQSLNLADLGNVELYYDKNIKKLRAIEAPSGVIVDPDEYIRMDDIVIPSRQKEMLYYVCNHVKYESKVYSEWGMDTKYRYGKGTPVLFAGPPGTGKTMAAHVLSNMLDIPLYKIDLSQVADKYIGETEKHLRKIFDFADENELILFFDEADSLFGKRSEVKDSKDRYANMEISYILQRVEQFNGVAILATNLRENMDSAFIRRMKYVIEFPMPNKDMREQIWKNSFSENVPTGNIDYEFLSEKFELSGGNIKNIILTATFLAAGKNEAVGMIHILEAVKNEYYKYNKEMTIEDFGKYGYMFL
jgi:SpoVK/Ycf46/Vps4 family AAA+-type ATPase